MNKLIYGSDFERDKNLTYRPQDESGDEDNASLLLDSLSTENIVHVIIKQHHNMRETIHVIKSRESTAVEKQRAFLDLVSLWTAYSQAEENTLYEEVGFSSEIKPQIDEAIKEHALEERTIAQIMVEDLENLNFRINWNLMIQSKAKSLAEVVEQHLKNDEETYLKMIVDILSQEDLQLLGHEFTRQFEATAAHNKASLKPSRLLS